MYITYPVLILILLFIAVILSITYYQWMKSSALKDLCRLSLSQRLAKLNDLLLPEHLRYDDAQDAFFLLPAAAELPDILESSRPRDYFFYHDGHTFRIRLMAASDGFFVGARVEIAAYRAVIPFEVCDLFPLRPLADQYCPYMELTFHEENRPLFSYSGRDWRIAGFQIHPQTASAVLTVKLTFPDDAMLHSVSKIPDITIQGQTAYFNIEAASLFNQRNRFKVFAYYFITGPAFRTVDRLLLLHGMRSSK